MRLIDAEAKICESEEWKKLKAKEKMNITEFIISQPTIDAEPIRHGHWERYDVDIAEHPYHCSHCGWSNHHISNRYVGEFKFCPECGTKIDEVGE